MNYLNLILESKKVTRNIDMQNNVSLCAIVKNSADTIDMFVRWGLDNFPEINLVVDTENDDETAELCCSWEDGYNNIHVNFHKFDNFSNQKQRSIDMATKDYVLIIDSDEIMEDLPDNFIENSISRSGYDILAFPRYNLQKDYKHFYTRGYPDFQYRATKKCFAKMNGKPVDETLELSDRRFGNYPFHIIHFGHIRSEEHLLLKGKDRFPFAKDDGCDGSSLIKHGEDWFRYRNLEFNNYLADLPQSIINQIERYV